MRTVAAIYTGAALVKPLSDQLKAALPGYRIMNILDDSMIAEIIAEGTLTKPVIRRLYAYYDAAISAGAELVLNTCSSIGDAVYAAREFLPVPIVRIDEAMARLAVAEGSRIAVLATLQTTLAPTIRLVERCASEAERSVVALPAVAEGAFPAITAGDTETHDRLIAEKAADIASGCDVILLAQASMARMEETLRALTGKRVYSSPRPAIEAIRLMLEGKD